MHPVEMDTLRCPMGRDASSMHACRLLYADANLVRTASLSPDACCDRLRLCGRRELRHEPRKGGCRGWKVGNSSRGRRRGAEPVPIEGARGTLSDVQCAELCAARWSRMPPELEKGIIEAALGEPYHSPRADPPAFSLSSPSDVPTTMCRDALEGFDPWAHVAPCSYLANVSSNRRISECNTETWLRANCPAACEICQLGLAAALSSTV